MKELKTIAEEVVKTLPKHFKPYLSTENHRYYLAISGFDFDGSYFSMCFREYFDGERAIEISSITDNPKKYVDLIKSICPESKVTYYKKETITTEIITK